MKYTGWLIATIVLGVWFLAGQGWEYAHIHAGWANSGIFGAS
ncbi:MAG: cytochrome c oxidase subunit 3, partial [Candidatus Eremiobacteraeota bacterium]|nr:cytochrome c oxidase subunit 3 [Candidatus Eremiobacteraeota bacterium]